MRAQPIIRVFSDYHSATDALRDLQDAGAPVSDVSILANRFVDRSTLGMTPDRPLYELPSDINKSHVEAEILNPGTSGPNPLTHIRSFTFSDIGPVVGMGWLAPTASGRHLGYDPIELSQTLLKCGLPDRDARFYASSVFGGATLVAVKGNGQQSEILTSIMDRHGGAVAHAPAKVARFGGWKRYDNRVEFDGLPLDDAGRDSI